MGGAAERIRTSTGLLPPAPQAGASASSATAAIGKRGAEFTERAWADNRGGARRGGLRRRGRARRGRARRGRRRRLGRGLRARLRRGRAGLGGRRLAEILEERLLGRR